MTNELFDELVIDISKLRDYCLSEQHPRGRNKARVFRSRLGLTSAHARQLHRALCEAVEGHSSDLRMLHADAYGIRLALDFTMSTQIGTAVIRAGWILRNGERVLRFLTCYVLD